MAYPTENLRSTLSEARRPDGRTDEAQKRLSSVLIVENDQDVLHTLMTDLGSQFSLVETAADSDAADALLSRCHFDLIISAIRLPGRSGLEWISQLRDLDYQVPVIFITAHADKHTAITAVRAGASDFQLKPFNMQQMRTAVTRCIERQRLKREKVLLRRRGAQRYEGSGFVGSCDLI